MKRHLIILVLALSACDKDPIPRDSDAYRIDGDCADINGAEINDTDWRVCNRAGQTFICGEDGCVPLLCGKAPLEVR